MTHLTYTTRELIQIAREHLTPDEFNVWITKHIAGRGRRAGSLALGITEDAWRYRLTRAELKLQTALERKAEAA